ncbi:MAG TPA: peptide deformylase [Candidatus Paceibacterota bacterium]|nr:peptide deformylase [Candidatus Paceibacterota bacterium]
MAKELKIVELGDKRLRAGTKNVAKIRDKKFQKFIDDLIHTCDIKNGVGIAAPQVGSNHNLFIVWSRPNKRYPYAPTLGPIAIINPHIISKSKKMKKGWEGCLSIPGVRALVSRHTSIEVEYETRDGGKVRETHKDFVARIFQHEYDHLKGVVFLDIVNTKDIVTEAEFQKILKKRK